jgi:hypothetical protein
MAGGYYHYFNYSNHRYTNTREPSSATIADQTAEKRLKHTSRVSAGKKAVSFSE